MDLNAQCNVSSGHGSASASSGAELCTTVRREFELDRAQIRCAPSNRAMGSSNSWELPKIRGPTIDPRQLGSNYKNARKEGTPNLQEQPVAASFTCVPPPVHHLGHGPKRFSCLGASPCLVILSDLAAVTLFGIPTQSKVYSLINPYWLSWHVCLRLEARCGAAGGGTYSSAGSAALKAGVILLRQISLTKGRRRSRRAKARGSGLLVESISSASEDKHLSNLHIFRIAVMRGICTKSYFLQCWRRMFCSRKKSIQLQQM